MKISKVLLTIYMLFVGQVCTSQIFNSNGSIRNGVAVHIKNVASGKYMTVKNNYKNNNRKIIQKDFTGEANQKFIITLKYTGCTFFTGDPGLGSMTNIACNGYRIQSVSSGKYLKVRNASVKRGVGLVQYQFQNSDSQIFDIDFTTSNLRTIRLEYRKSIQGGILRSIHQPANPVSGSSQFVLWDDQTTNRQIFELIEARD